MQAPLHSITEVNTLPLLPGDSLLFKRGSTCTGELQPLGSGTQTAPIRIAAYGEGALPRIIADAQDAAALRLSNQQFWEVQSLDLSGGATYGVLVEASGGTMHHLVLRDLRVHDVRGPLRHKESGLVVVHPTGANGGLDDVLVDGVHAFNTTQWSGIFISGANHVQVRNSVVHDVQGDGIVVFRSENATIGQSVAWHTGMQHQETIGTPNALWTWRCMDCTVEDNEAFLTDSPGIDGGAFDIDFGNTRNTVQRNFGHDTAGYCVSVFAAFGPTTESVVADNLCLNNGMSPHLAQRQGALLLMTWQGGSLDGVEIRGNRIDWTPPGDAPAIQSGTEVHASKIILHDNVVESTGISFVDPQLKYTGERNRYSTEAAVGIREARRRMALLPEKDSTLSAVKEESLRIAEDSEHSSESGSWQLVATISPRPSDVEEFPRATLVELDSAALQYGHTGLAVTLLCGPGLAALARDWSLPDAGVLVKLQSTNAGDGFSLKLIAPDGTIIREWKAYPGPVELGLALRQHVGRPNFSFLPFENVRATD
jgi:hypothetical protein